jgi:hypothetical protein
MQASACASPSARMTCRSSRPASTRPCVSSAATTGLDVHLCQPGNGPSGPLRAIDEFHIRCSAVAVARPSAVDQTHSEPHRSWGWPTRLPNSLTGRTSSRGAVRPMRCNRANVAGSTQPTVGGGMLLSRLDSQRSAQTSRAGQPLGRPPARASVTLRGFLPEISTEEGEGAGDASRRDRHRGQRCRGG